MELTMGRLALRDALSAPAQVASKGRLSYMACVRIRARAGAAFFEANDGTRSALVSCDAMVGREGACVVGAERLMGIVRALPEEAVTLSADGAFLSVVCGGAAFRLPTLSEELFCPGPNAPGEGSPEAVVDGPRLRDAVRTAARFASRRSEALPVFGCVHVRCAGGTATVSATDTYRIVQLRVEGAQGEGFAAAYPAAFFADALGFCGDGEVVLSADADRMQLAGGGACFRCAAVSGQWPSVAGFFDGKPVAHATADRAALLAAARRAKAAGARCAVCVEVKPGAVRLSCALDDGGKFAEEVPAECAGAGSAFLSAPYLADELAAADSERVRVAIGAKCKPVVFDGGSMRGMVMPLRG